MHRFRHPLRFVVGASLLAVALGTSSSGFAAAPHAPAGIPVPSSLAVTRQLGAPPAGVAELKFRDIFKLPVGPRGLEPAERLKSLDGKRVRLVGYMVHQETPTAGVFMLSPLPVVAGDEDESLADDIPASAINVSLPKARDALVPMLPGLIRVTGILRVGPSLAEGTERLAPARIELDAEPERALVRVARAVGKSSTHAPR